MSLEILLATYNGETFLPELLDSLLRQSYAGWQVLARDDGSTDATRQILHDYSTRYPGKFSILQDDEQRLGACASFTRLLDHSRADRFLFCDQDDVWLPEKIALTMQKMDELEARHGQIPLLVHTDLRVVDRNLQPICESFWRYQHLNPNWCNIHQLLVQNNVTGCTTMINRQLKAAALPIPGDAIMHDWWLALVASVLGVISHVETPTILYRQHGANSCGARQYSLQYFLERWNRLEQGVNSIRKVVRQGAVFYQSFRSQLPTETSTHIQNFSQLLQKNGIGRLGCLCKQKHWKYGMLRNLGFLAIILFMGQDRP